MKTGIIYRAIGPSGKSYIGQTKFLLENRKVIHRAHAQYLLKKRSHFYNAIRKYGFDSFVWEIIFSGIPLEHLDWYEIWTIQLFDSFKKGYNSTIGGSGNRGFRHKDSTKKKMSEMAKQRPNIGLMSPWTAARRRKISDKLLGKPKTREHKKNISRGLCKYTYQVIFPDGFIEYTDNLNKYCRGHNLNSGHMYQVARGKKAHYKGYRCVKITNLDTLQDHDRLSKVDCYEEQVKFLNGPQG